MKRQLLATGWVEGPPPRLPETARLTDARVCKHMRCPNRPDCPRRGMLYNAFHHPLRQRYTVVAECPTCGSGEVY